MAWDVAAMAWERAKGRGVDDYVGRGGARVLDLLLVVGRQFVGDALLVVVERVLHLCGIDGVNAMRVSLPLQHAVAASIARDRHDAATK